MRKDKFDIKAAVCLKSLTIYCKYSELHANMKTHLYTLIEQM